MDHGCWEQKSVGRTRRGRDLEHQDQRSIIEYPCIGTGSFEFRARSLFLQEIPRHCISMHTPQVTSHDIDNRFTYPPNQREAETNLDRQTRDSIQLHHGRRSPVSAELKSSPTLRQFTRSAKLSQRLGVPRMKVTAHCSNFFMASRQILLSLIR